MQRLVAEPERCHPKRPFTESRRGGRVRTHPRGSPRNLTGFSKMHCRPQARVPKSRVFTPSPHHLITKHGTDGYNISQDSSSYPAYATVSISGQSNNTWSATTSDARALTKGGSSTRIAACWFSTTSFTFDVNLTDGFAHKVSLYCLDWDNISRVESISVLDRKSVV